MDPPPRPTTTGPVQIKMLHLLPLNQQANDLRGRSRLSKKLQKLKEKQIKRTLAKTLSISILVLCVVFY